ncbi:MAG: aldose 1-epimerase [Geminicoccaceae bacterium]
MISANPIDLALGDLQLTIIPKIGGGVARLDWRDVAILRPWDGISDDPNALGCYTLLPWSNRISGRGIEAGGRFWPLRANWPGAPYPIHGEGWQRPWRVERRTDAEVVLGLESDGQPPFDYRALLTYALAHDALTMRLAVEHRGTAAVPYGLGFHPWLPRTPGTRLELPASEVWLETADHLPAGKVPVSARPDWDFRRERPLPDAWINNAFSGWPGTARVSWPERGLRLTVTATPELDTCILYSPDRDATFFCLEPVSHPVDAFHLPGMPGLRVLQPGERFEVACTFVAEAL